MTRKKIVKGYKATNKDMICNPNNNPFQYELGKEYKEEKANLCNCGFHFCENPLDVLNYYDVCDSRFFEIEAKDVSEERKNDTKRVSKKIKLTAEIGLNGLIKAGFDYIKEQCEIKEIETNKRNIIDSGNDSQVATSGYDSQVATSGYKSQVATSGDGSQVAINGEYSVGMCAGINSKIKGKKGNWITLAEWKYNEDINKVIPICVKSVQIDGKVIKEDTYYKLENGEFIEC